MKFVRRISLFFIYPMVMFGIGFITNTFIQNFFYPGDAASEENIYVKESDKIEEEKVMETVVADKPVITADTGYVVIAYDMIKDITKEELQITPDKYIGLNRQELEEALKEYNRSPSLTDLEQGFSNIELLSFSPEKVIVRKNYEKPESGFYLINENHNVVVYDKSLKYMYMNTGIKTKELPKELQQEVLYMKFIENENDLYHFLESYSS